MGKGAKTYCEAAREKAVFRNHHEKEHGFPTKDSNVLFERLMLEVMQAGLNWQLIINKRDNFKKAFDNFSVKKVAEYDEEKIASLLQDTGIIRSEKKIKAAIHNAKAIMSFEAEESMSFSGWLDKKSDEHQDDIAAWLKDMRKKFKFIGPEIIKEFLTGCGYLAGAHEKSCPVYQDILPLKPKFLQHLGNKGG